VRSSWAARFGAVSAGVTLALYGVLQAVDGVALKQTVDAWVRAPDAEKAARFASAETIRWLEWGVRSYQSFMLGLAFILFAIGPHWNPSCSPIRTPTRSSPRMTGRPSSTALPLAVITRPSAMHPTVASGRVMRTVMAFAKSIPTRLYGSPVPLATCSPIPMTFGTVFPA
jgi:hypothetical protein